MKCKFNFGKIQEELRKKKYNTPVSRFTVVCCSPQCRHGNHIEMSISLLITLKVLTSK